MQNFRDKVALVTGGASGLGLAYGEELLRNEVKHLVILDLATSAGEELAKKLNAEFGEKRVIFVPCDVTDEKQFEAGFVKTIGKFGGLDILINNAGVLNEPKYQLMIDINFTAVVRGTMLGLRYMGKDRGGKGGVIVNVASIFGLDPTAYAPVYDGTKHAVVGFSRCMGLPLHHDRTGVRVLTMCPGISETPLLASISDYGFPEFIDAEKAVADITDSYPLQKVDSVAKGMINIIKSAESGSVWVAEGGEPVHEVLIPDRFSIKAPSKK